MHLGACSGDLPAAYVTLSSSMPTLCASVGEQMMLSVCSYISIWLEMGSKYEELGVGRTRPSYFEAIRLGYEGYELQFLVPGYLGPQV